MLLRTSNRFSDFYRNFLPRLYFDNPTVQFQCVSDNEQKIKIVLCEDLEQPESTNCTKSIPIEAGDNAEMVAKRFLSSLFERENVAGRNRAEIGSPNEDE